jgi:RNA polymerase sigma-70 factor (ECF subfamily)
MPVEETAFEEMFKSHFRRLYAYAITIVKEEMTAEEIVHNVFFKIWEKKGDVDIQTSVTAYLYRAVYNDSLNYLKHKKVKLAYAAHAGTQSKEESHSATSKIHLSELQQKLDVALGELPEQCRTIFQMSRFEELKYAEIAGRLGISVKTVENQMGKALKILRTKLADYLPLLIVLLESFNTNNC